jgi:hypothetical protein
VTIRGTLQGAPRGPEWVCTEDLRRRLEPDPKLAVSFWTLYAEADRLGLVELWSMSMGQGAYLKICGWDGEDVLATVREVVAATRAAMALEEDGEAAARLDLAAGRSLDAIAQTLGMHRAMGETDADFRARTQAFHRGEPVEP